MRSIVISGIILILVILFMGYSVAKTNLLLNELESLTDTLMPAEAEIDSEENLRAIKTLMERLNIFLSQYGYLFPKNQDLFLRLSLEKLQASAQKPDPSLYEVYLLDWKSALQDVKRNVSGRFRDLI